MICWTDSPIDLSNSMDLLQAEDLVAALKLARKGGQQQMMPPPTPATWLASFATSCRVPKSMLDVFFMKYISHKIQAVCQTSCGPQVQRASDLRKNWRRCCSNSGGFTKRCMRKAAGYPYQVPVSQSCPGKLSRILGCINLATFRSMDVHEVTSEIDG